MTETAPYSNKPKVWNFFSHSPFKYGQKYTEGYQIASFQKGLQCIKSYNYLGEGKTFAPCNVATSYTLPWLWCNSIKSVTRKNNNRVALVNFLSSSACLILIFCTEVEYDILQCKCVIFLINRDIWEIKLSISLVRIRNILVQEMAIYEIYLACERASTCWYVCSSMFLRTWKTKKTYNLRIHTKRYHFSSDTRDHR